MSLYLKLSRVRLTLDPTEQLFTMKCTHVLDNDVDYNSLNSIILYVVVIRWPCLWNICGHLANYKEVVAQEHRSRVIGNATGCGFDSFTFLSLRKRIEPTTCRVSLEEIKDLISIFISSPWCPGKARRWCFTIQQAMTPEFHGKWGI